MKYAAGPARETKNGPRINVLVILVDGEEIKLWGDPGDPALTPLKKGQSVQLVKNAKGKGYSLLDTSPGTPADPPAKVPELDFRALRGDQFDSVQPEFGCDGNFGGLGLQPLAKTRKSRFMALQPQPA